MQHSKLRNTFFSCTSLCSSVHPFSEVSPLSRHVLTESFNMEHYMMKQENLIRHESSLELEALISNPESASTPAEDKKSNRGFFGKYFLNEIFDYNVLMENIKSKNKACMCKPIEANRIEQIHPPKTNERINHEPIEDKIHQEILRGNQEYLSDVIKQTIGKEIKIIVCDGTCCNKSDEKVSLIQQREKSIHSSNSSKCNCKGCKDKESKFKWFKFCKRKKTKPEHSPKMHSTSINTISDKSAQTQVDKNDTEINTENVPHNTTSTSCNCCMIDTNRNADNASLYKERKSQNMISHPEPICSRCGKVDPERVGNHCASCKEQTDTLKLLIKMEAKQNFRQINSILQELAYQREELRRLNELYDDIFRNLGNSPSSPKFETGSEKNVEHDKDVTKSLGCNLYNCPERNKNNIKSTKDMVNKSKYALSRSSIKTEKSEHNDIKQSPSSRGNSYLSLFGSDDPFPGPEDKPKKCNCSARLQTNTEVEASRNYNKSDYVNKSVGFSSTEDSEKYAKSNGSVNAKKCCKFVDNRPLARRICDFVCR